MKAIYLIPVILLAASLAGAQDVRVPQAQAPAVVEWSQDTFEADVYPSQRAAAKRLAIKWIEQIDSLQQPPTSIHLSAEAAVTREALREVGRAVQARFPNLKVAVELDPQRLLPAQVLAGELWAVIVVEHDEQASQTRATPRSTGALTISPADPQQRSVSVRFVDKPWADNFAQFLNERPGQRWIVGWPQGPAMSEAEAHAHALRSASANLLNLVQARMQQRNAWNARDHTAVRNLVDAAVLSGRFTNDRFVQRFDRGFTTTWREAVLIDASQPNVDLLANQCIASLQGQRETWAKSILSVAVLFVVIYGLYVALNAATKGYFVWRLRLVAVILAVLGLLAIMALVTVRLETGDRALPRQIGADSVDGEVQILTVEPG